MNDATQPMLSKSAPHGLGAFFGRLDAVAIVSDEGLLTPEDWPREFSRCGSRLAEIKRSRHEVLCAMEWMKLAP
ncbi:hypothetical protein CORC01_07063 [Colletotrichum orchidophilum]|uniref:Uncharacterized protein n=1 Tax=Colletotrichum orchidophilum TaxID=1209926 RepID=A0A1G4B867_9PEZI|nr:uncharacterized protein CORC01_07063 [Colletotrichum orchidophilum]OHE97648.1 hypothetical protein CORC01_07063 [Colletotrichum orchidophilum]